ncbi:uncharacterized protein LOC127734922 isoform X2 [Mytilus californianus]|uniref:uncharacterized protein LOC127734922 isoform X2 n=1 Tax=Mytilus californianus TaxID=6549 RepID=UPI0022473F0A|nr:uncharacterized protein LOC127734922 isoform X2 [Mytilus californianus]
MGKNKRQRKKAKIMKNMKENENHLHVTPVEKSTDRKKYKQEPTDKSFSDRAHKKSPIRKNMDSRSLTEDVNGKDDSYTTKNEVGMSKQNDTCAADFDNSKQSEQGVFTDQEDEIDTVHPLITQSTNEYNKNEEEPKVKESTPTSDESNCQHSDENEHTRSDDSRLDNTKTESLTTLTESHTTEQDCEDKIDDDQNKSGDTERHLKQTKSCQIMQGDDLHLTPDGTENNDQKQDNFGDIHHNKQNTATKHTMDDKNIPEKVYNGPFEFNDNAGGFKAKKQVKVRENSNDTTDDSLSKISITEQAYWNTGDNKENHDDGGFINENTSEKGNGQNMNGHIRHPRDDLDKAITVNDPGRIDFDNGDQNQQGQSQVESTDQETAYVTFHSSITLCTIENNQNEEELKKNENILISNKSRYQHSEENDHDGTIGSKVDKTDTKTFPTVNTETLITRGDGGDKSDDEQDKSDDSERHLTNSCLNMEGDYLSLAPECPQSNDQTQNNVADIQHNIANTTPRHTIISDEQFSGTGSKTNIDQNNQGQNKYSQPTKMNHMTVYSESSTTLQCIDQPSTFIQNEMKGGSSDDFLGDNNTSEKGNNGPSEIENIYGDFIQKGIRNHVQTKFESIDNLTKENIGNDDDGSISEKENGKNINGHVQQPREELGKAVNKDIILLKTQLDSLKEESESIKVQIQQSVEETKEAFHQELKTLQQQLESVTQEKIDLSECKCQLEQGLKREKYELVEWKEKAIKLESEKVERDRREQKLEKVIEDLRGWKEESVTQEDVMTESWKEIKEKTDLRLTSFEVELISARQEKEKFLEDKNQLEEQLLQVNDELERWKQNNARLESQQAQSQQSMEETKNSIQQELANLQQQLESAKEENFNLLEGKNQSERELETVTGELDESREKTNELQNQNEEIQQSLEETKHSLHQELSSLQNQLDSAKQENSNIQDEKHQLVHEQQLLRKEFEECKAKLSQLENRKEQLNISTKVIEDTIKQEYSSIQRHLESNGSEGQDYTRLSDDKDRLEEELMHVNSELDEMKEKVVELENVKGEKDQLEQELDRMREIAGQLESMKEETERYRAQYQQINDQLRTTEQQLEQSYQECEGLSADLARKGEKEEHYRYIETMVVTLGREKESHLREIQELKTKVDLVEEVLSSLKEEKKRKDETIKQLKADVQVKEENSHQIKRQYEAGIEQLRTMGRSRDSEIETQKREIARITSQKQQLEENIFKTSIELKTKQSELQREQLELNNTRNTLTQYAEAIKKMNSQVQSKDKEIEIMQEEVNKIRIESREFQLKYRDLPQKEANFKVIENSNRFLIEENAQLQERIRSFGPFERTLHYLREENSRLSWEGQRYQERISFMEQKYRDQTYSIQQLNEEVQVFRGHRIELKRQLHQKTDEAESVSRRLKDTLEKKENLERELQGENPESQNFGDSHGPEGHNVQAIPGQHSGRGRLIRRT